MSQLSLTNRAKLAAEFAKMEPNKSHAYVRRQTRLQVLTELELANDSKGFKQVNKATNLVVKDAKNKMNAARRERKAALVDWIVIAVLIISSAAAGAVLAALFNA